MFVVPLDVYQQPMAFVNIPVVFLLGSVLSGGETSRTCLHNT